VSDPRASPPGRDTARFKCLCGARLEWVEKGKLLRCPREGIEYVL